MTNRRSDNVTRSLKSVYISSELLKDVKELKREGIPLNLSQICEEAVKRTVERYKDDNIAFHLQKQKRKAEEELEEAKEKIEEIEEKAADKLDAPLEEYVEENEGAGESRWDKKVQEWAEEYNQQKENRHIKSIDEHDIRDEAKNIWDLRIEQDYGIQGRKKIDFHEEAVEYIREEML